MSWPSSGQREGAFLAFLDPGVHLPPGQLVRLNTPAGAKLQESDLLPGACADGDGRSRGRPGHRAHPVEAGRNGRSCSSDQTARLRVWYPGGSTRSAGLAPRHPHRTAKPRTRWISR